MAFQRQVRVYHAEAFGTFLTCTQVPPSIRGYKFILATSLPDRMISQPPVLLLRCNQSIPSSTYVGFCYFILGIHFLLYLKDPAVYPCFDIYRADFLKMEDRRVSLSVMLPAQYPALNLCESWHRFF
jgi:hypothetical protein